MLPPPNHAPPVGPLPALAAGHVTFGCLNKLIKVTPAMMRAWGKILAGVPGSRLVVLAAGAGSEPDAAWVRRMFAAEGVPVERVELVPRTRNREYLELYNRIDVALDSFPYNGHTTTLGALWMGVPTITMSGDSHLTREGLGVLRQMGLDDWVAATPDQYVEKTVQAVADSSALAKLRDDLRARMVASPLCDGSRLIQALEAAYHDMWRQWRRRSG